MKTIILLLAIVSFIPVVYAVPMFNPEMAFDYPEFVVIGEITSVKILADPNNDPDVVTGIALYTVEIEEHLKYSPNNGPTITVPGPYRDATSGRDYSVPLYQVGQRVLFYIQDNPHMPDYDYILRDRASGVLSGSLCDAGDNFSQGVCVTINDTTISTYAPCIDSRGDTCGDPNHYDTTREMPLCGAGTVYENGVCRVIQSTEPTRMQPSIFLDGILILMLISPFFIPAAVIFVVLSKTPRYNIVIRIAVSIASILVLMWFLWALSIGVYPPGYG